MNPSHIYIAMSIIVLAILALIVFFFNKNRKRKNLTPLTGLAFGFILTGIFFSDDRYIGYSLIGIGVIFAVIDIIQKYKNR